MRTIEKKDLETLEGFVGYGRKDAEVIFIGLEESGGGYDNFNVRLNTQNYSYLDCKRFHIDKLKCFHLHSDDNESYNNIKFQPVWRFVSYFMLRLEGINRKEIFAKNRLKLRKYQSDFIGTTKGCGKTLLTEIYPIPCQKFKWWKYEKKNKEGKVILREHYKDIFPFPDYQKKSKYKKKIIPKRVAMMKELINSKEFSAKTIICYGKSGWNEFQKFFHHLNVDFIDKSNKSYKVKVGYLNISNGRKLKIFLTPFFGNGQMSYDYLDKLVKEAD